MCRVTIALFLLALSPLGAAASDETAPRPSEAPTLLTLERIYDGPPLGGPALTAMAFSADGAFLAFLRRVDPEASPSLEVVEVGTGRRSTLLGPDALPADDGEDAASLASFAWSPDGSALALRSSRGDLFVVDRRRGKVRRLTSTEADEEDPKFSPDGRWLAFRRDHDLFVLPVAGGDEVRLTEGGSEDLLNGETDWVTCEELDLCTGFWWSPDSLSVAYLQYDLEPVYRYPLTDWIPVRADVTWQRYPKAGTANARARVGVVARGGGETRWVAEADGETGYLARVHWSAEGGSLLVHRLDRMQERLTVERVPLGGEGETTPLLEETDPHWVNLTDDFIQLADGRLVRSSERTGFRHLDLHDADGRLVRALTEGDWMVTALHAVDETGGWVYFSATEPSVLERQLYRVRLDGSGRERLTPEPGTHSTRFDEEGTAYVDHHSSVRQVGLYRLCRPGQPSVCTVLNPEAESALEGLTLPQHRFLIVQAADGTSLNAQLIRPADFDPARRYPVLVYVYGGPHAQIVRDRWGGRRYLWHALMAQSGYLVFTLDNRGSYGRGKAFETALDRDMGRQELADQLAGVSYLKSLPYVDPERIGIWGRSYGGYMTLYALTHAPGVFSAGVSVAPVTDWTLYDTIYTERYMETPERNPEGYVESSPLKSAGQLQGKLLLVHGTGDDNVHVQNSVQMIHALVEAGIPFELQLYPRATHGIRRAKERIHLQRAITRFLLENL